ncbi:MAG: hypothetical protein AAF437_14205 [Pseudomonadota bacterium]
MKTDRATIFVMDGGEAPSDDYLKVIAWFEKWSGSVQVFGYSTGGAEHIWDVEGSQAAIEQIPAGFRTHSAWMERIGSRWKLKSSPLAFSHQSPKKRN